MKCARCGHDAVYHGGAEGFRCRYRPSPMDDQCPCDSFTFDDDKGEEGEE